MPTIFGEKDPHDVIQNYGKRCKDTSLGGLMQWTVRTVESLYYLDDLDRVFQNNYPVPVGPHSVDAIDVAHVRWATGTAITALDLCAAVLGRVYCDWKKDDKEMDLRHFDVDAGKKRAETNRPLLPQLARTWVDDVLNDPNYKDIHSARNRFTHAWLSRVLDQPVVEGGSPIHQDRTEFKIKTAGSKQLGARTLVENSKHLAGKHVNAFIELIDRLEK